MDEIMSELWNFTSVQQRMIPQESILARQAQADRVPSLLRQSRDAVMLRLTSNNSQERLVQPLVDRLVLQADDLNQDINPVKDRLLTSLSGGSIIMAESDSVVSGFIFQGSLRFKTFSYGKARNLRLSRSSQISSPDIIR